MMKRLSSLSAVSFLAFLLALLLLANPSVARDAALSGLKLCAYAVIPSLFPFAAAVELMFYNGRAVPLPQIIERAVTFVFGVPASLCAAFLTGLAAGFPMGALAVCRVYNSGKCTSSEAEYAIALSNNPSPAFVLGAVGISLFGSLHAGLFLFGIQLISVFPVSAVLRLTAERKGEKTAVLKSLPLQDNESPTFSSAVTESVKRAGQSMISICSFVVFFTVLSAFFCTDGVSESIAPAVISGLFEMTSGVMKLSSVPVLHALLCALAILGFGGLSVMCQIAFVCEDTGGGLGMRRFVFSRILYAFFNFVIGTLVMLSFPMAVPTANYLAYIKKAFPSYACAPSAPYFKGAFIFSMLFFLLATTLFAAERVSKKRSERLMKSRKGGNRITRR